MGCGELVVKLKLKLRKELQPGNVLELTATDPGAPRRHSGTVSDSADDTVADVIARAQRAIELYDYDQVFLNTDCGFATFTDNPIQSARAAERDLSLFAQARDQLRGQYGC